jgi:hypothetical protein
VSAPPALSLGIVLFLGIVATLVEARLEVSVLATTLSIIQFQDAHHSVDFLLVVVLLASRTKHVILVAGGVFFFAWLLAAC